ncbi:MAG: AEC family transporter [Chitinophagales bacterium]
MTAPVLIIVERLFQVAVYLTIGFVARRTRLLDETILPGLSNFVYQLFLPTVIFYSALRGARLLEWRSMVLPALSLSVTAISLEASLLYQRWRFGRRESASVAVAGAFGNTAFLGIPLCAALFGAAGGAQAALCDFGNTLVTFTLGAHLLARRNQGGGAPRGWWRAAANRNTLALAMGLLAGRLPVVPPEWLVAPVAGVAGAALPVAMIVVGATIAGLSARRDMLVERGEGPALAALSHYRVLFPHHPPLDAGCLGEKLRRVFGGEVAPAPDAADEDLVLRVPRDQGGQGPAELFRTQGVDVLLAQEERHLASRVTRRARRFLVELGQGVGGLLQVGEQAGQGGGTRGTGRLRRRLRRGGGGWDARLVRQLDVASDQDLPQP